MKLGDLSLFLWTHSFISVTFEPGTGRMQNTKANLKPDFVFDPWGSGRPLIFKAEDFLRVWPLVPQFGLDLWNLGSGKPGI